MVDFGVVMVVVGLVFFVSCGITFSSNFRLVFCFRGICLLTLSEDFAVVFFVSLVFESDNCIE